MNRIAIGLFLSLFILSWGCQNNGGSGAAETELVQDGQSIFKKQCVTCHGLKGDMGAGGAANLRESQLSVEERIVVITKGRNAMQPYEEVLSAEQIEAVAQYTMVLRDSLQ
ncbi:MAG: cytochrome c [Saprospiraceae bacterium]|nr:cytochrome c [Saprospiraceae bacterium]